MEQARDHSQNSVPQAKHLIQLYWGKSCINIKVNFVIECIGGDRPGHRQLGNCLYIYRIFKNGGKSPRLVGDFSIIMRI